MNREFNLALLTLIALQVGCGSSSTGTSSSASDSTSNTVQTAVQQTNSQTSATEGGSTSFRPLLVHADSVCNYNSARRTCSSNADTINWNSCYVGLSLATMSGSYTETFTGGSGTCEVPLVNGESVVRTSTGSVLTLASGLYVTTDTGGGNTWDSTVLPSTGTTVSSDGTTRTIAATGTHIVGRTSAGTKYFEHYMTSSITATGTRAARTREVNGTVTVWHNLLKYKAVLSFSNVQWTDASCCFPTAGTVNGTLTGFINGTTTTTFSSTCGSATYVDTSGTSSPLTLTNCN